MALFRFGNMDDMFGNMDAMMNQMMNGMFSDPFQMTPFGRGPNLMSAFNQFPNMMQQVHAMPSNGTSFVSSSFVSYSSDGNNPPQVYEETKMNHYGPGGVREERHTVRDSRTGVQKMKLGRHIQDRGHVMERSKNHYTGDEEENNEYINIEEEEAPQFQQEWSTRMNRNHSGRFIEAPRPPPQQRLAIMAPQAYPTPESSIQSCSTSNSTNVEPKKMKLKQTMKNKKTKKQYKFDQQ